MKLPQKSAMDQMVDNLLLAIVGAFAVGFCVGGLLSNIEKLYRKNGVSSGE